MTRKSRVEYNAIAWVSEIQLCVRSVVLSSMGAPSLAWRVTCTLNMPHQDGEVLGACLNRSESGRKWWPTGAGGRGSVTQFYFVQNLATPTIVLARAGFGPSDDREGSGQRSSEPPH